MAPKGKTNNKKNTKSCEIIFNSLKIFFIDSFFLTLSHNYKAKIIYKEIIPLIK